MDKKLLAEVRFQFAQCVFNNKIQELAANRKQSIADRFQKYQLFLIVIVIIVLALQAIGFNSFWLNVIGIASAAADLVFIIVELTYGYAKQAQGHRAAAQKYLGLRSQYSSLITDIMVSTKKNPESYTKRDYLNEMYRMLADSPRTNQTDYEQAQSVLGTDGQKNKEQFTWSDKEIDRFLPSELKISKKAKIRYQ